MHVPSCVRGLGTRICWCRNGHISFSYSDGVAVTMTALDVGYKEFKLQKNLYAVRVDVSPLTQVSDIVAAMDPVLDPLGIVIPFDEVMFVMEVPDSDPNAMHPTGVLSLSPSMLFLLHLTRNRIC